MRCVNRPTCTVEGVWKLSPIDGYKSREVPVRGKAGAKFIAQNQFAIVLLTRSQQDCSASQASRRQNDGGGGRMVWGAVFPARGGNRVAACRHSLNEINVRQ